MSDKDSSGSPFVNKLVALYLANVDPKNHLDVIETFIDTVAEDNFSHKARSRVAIALDFYASKNELLDDDYDEIDEFYENIVDKGVVQMPNTPEEALARFTAADNVEKFLLLKEYFTYLSGHIFSQMLPYYIGEVMILREEKVFTRLQTNDLWRTLNSHSHKAALQEYFLNTHDMEVKDFMAKSFQNELFKNIELRDNIATDWLIFMQDHSSQDGDELMHRVFGLMSSEE